MRSARVCLLSLVCVGGAFAFGLVANAAIDLVIPAAPGQAAATVGKPAVEAQPATYALASTTSTPVDLAPIKVKTIPLLYREERAETAAPEADGAAVPLPRPRPARRPRWRWLSTESLATSRARSRSRPRPARASRTTARCSARRQVERMKMALALTAEQEEYWPAIAAELRALGKAMKSSAKAQGGKISVDQEAMQRLYWAAAPLITRLSYEQKTKVKQMARLMGLNQVAEAL